VTAQGGEGEEVLTLVSCPARPGRCLYVPTGMAP
jgi:hypothetical protein